MSDLQDGPAEAREVIVFGNPIAGSRGGRRLLSEMIDALRTQGLDPLPCGRREELTNLVRARADRLRCVVAAGGDGTLNEVLNRAPGLPVAVLPLGNENLAARCFRLGRSPFRLARAIAAASPRQMDLGRANGRLFSLMAGIGFDAQVIHDVHDGRRGHINKGSYALPVVRALATYPFPPIEVTIEETGEHLRGAMIFLFNLPAYGLGLPIAPLARPDDGWLDLLVFRQPGVWPLACYLGAILCRRHDRLADVEYRRVKRVHMRSEQPVPVQVDGDPAGHLPATVEVVPAAWKLLVPGTDSG